MSGRVGDRTGDVWSMTRYGSRPTTSSTARSASARTCSGDGLGSTNALRCFRSICRSPVGAGGACAAAAMGSAVTSRARVATAIDFMVMGLRFPCLPAYTGGSFDADFVAEISGGVAGLTGKVRGEHTPEILDRM